MPAIRPTHNPLMRPDALHRFLLLAWLLVITSSLYAQPAYLTPAEMLGGKKKVTIPFRFANNFILLDVRIYGILPMQLIFDTGAEHLILFKRQYTDLLQVTYDKRIPVMGADLSREIYALITRNALVKVDGLDPRPHDILVLEEDYFNLDEMIGTPVAGLIGGGFFKNLIIQIDYKRRRLTLIDPAGFDPPGDHLALPMTVRTQKPYIRAEAGLQDGTVVQVDLLVDTGAGVPLLLHNNSHPDLHLPDTYIRGRLGMGLGGFIEGYIGRIDRLSIGEVDFPGVITSYQDIQEEWLMDQTRFRHGILGNELLSRFSVYFDFLRNQLYLKPYRNKQRPFSMDRSGMILFAYGMDFNQFVVRDLIDPSPALEADIRQGDILVRLQGMDAEALNLDAILSILQKRPGKKIRLHLIRDGVLIRKEFRLRDLI